MCLSHERRGMTRYIYVLLSIIMAYIAVQRHQSCSSQYTLWVGAELSFHCVHYHYIVYDVIIRLHFPLEHVLCPNGSSSSVPADSSGGIGFLLEWNCRPEYRV